MRSLLRVKGSDRHAQIHGAALRLPPDHALPHYVALYPDYSANVVRLAEAVSAKYPASPLIDVGANIGDTVAFWRAKLESPILAVEGDPHWLPYLSTNTDQFADVTLAHVFLGPSTGTVSIRADRHRGTSAFIQDDAKGSAAEMCTPRELLTRFPEFRRSHLVKSDTDGFDYAIVKSFIGELLCPPVFFFEHDPSFSSSGVEESIELRQALVSAGYGMTLWWDNFGRFLVTANLEDEGLWESLTRYVPAPSSVYYWDVAAFPHADADVAESLRIAELARTP